VIGLFFNSISFFITFIIMALVYYVMPHKLRWIVLLLYNCFFYIMLMGDKSIMLLYIALVVYIMALAIQISPKGLGKWILSAFFVVLLISYLLYYKYYNFIALNLRPFIFIKEKSILAPVGISFYTMQAISYIVDVYKGKLKAEKHLGYFLVYLGFFGTILSGPIERAEKFLPQIREKKSFCVDNILSAMNLILFGLFKKVIIADGISVYVNKVFDNPYGYTMAPVAFAIFLYSIQLYADFSGYSLMAVGFSKVLGFDIINNFDFPYFSKSIREFWRRWHISFSSFLRDYVYFPLGGSRVSKTRHYLNTLIVFFISGVWHGASWNFIFWGTLHGVYIVIENIISKISLGKKFYSLKVINVIVTFVLATIAWVFFRADTMKHALHLIKASIIRDAVGATSLFSLITTQRLIVVIITVGLLFIYEYMLFKGFGKNKKVRYTANAVMIILFILLGQATEGQFIYFKF
jgi:alginate O-acetyltransferase complex protein AlgI